MTVREEWSLRWSPFQYGPLVVWKRIYGPLFFVEETK